MVSVRVVARAVVRVAVVMLAVGGAAFGQTHAPWPTDWNNWKDPALWVTVGNPGNARDTRYGTFPRFGAVAYTFNIGKFEVTAGQYTAFLNAVAKTDTYGLYDAKMADTAIGSFGCNIKRTGSSGAYDYSVDADWANRPVNFVSWGDAARFANWLTNGQSTGAQNGSTTEDGSYYLNGAITDADLLAVTRKANAKYVIPTEDEWYKAAYHKNDGVTGNYFDYPTGSNSVPNNDLISPDPGNTANFNANWPDDLTIGSPYYRTEVGEFENSESPYGTFDQGGNVWEFNEAIIISYRGLRGGPFSNVDDYMHAAIRNSYGSTSGHDAIGFRVSEVPEPATLSLLALGGLLALRRRR